MHLAWHNEPLLSLMMMVYHIHQLCQSGRGIETTGGAGRESSEWKKDHCAHHTATLSCTSTKGLTSSMPQFGDTSSKETKHKSPGMKCNTSASIPTMWPLIISIKIPHSVTTNHDFQVLK